jgi:hypothetical protein
MLTTRESDLAEENRELKQRLEALESGESADAESGT